MRGHLNTARRLDYVQRTHRKEPRVYVQTVYQAARSVTRARAVAGGGPLHPGEAGPDAEVWAIIRRQHLAQRTPPADRRGSRTRQALVVAEEWHEWFRMAERKGRPVDRSVPYLPWYAAKLRGIYRDTRTSDPLPLGRWTAGGGRRRADEIALDDMERKERLLRIAFPSIVDWAIATKTDLGPLGFIEAREKTRAWHDQLAAAPAKVLTSSHQGHVVHRWPTGWTVQQIGGPLVGRRTNRLLTWEGEAMGHCVGQSGYAVKVNNGALEIFSLRDPKGQPHATVSRTPARAVTLPGGTDALQGWKVEDVQGRSDTLLKATYRELLNEWLDADPDDRIAPVKRRGFLTLDRLDRLVSQETPDEDALLWESGTQWADPMVVDVAVHLLPAGDLEVYLFAAIGEEDWLQTVIEIRDTLTNVLLADPRLQAWLPRLAQPLLPGMGATPFLEDYEKATRHDLRGELMGLVESALNRKPRPWVTEAEAAVRMGDPMIWEKTLKLRRARAAGWVKIAALGHQSADQLRDWQIGMKERIGKVRAEASNPKTRWVKRGITAIMGRVGEP